MGLKKNPCNGLKRHVTGQLFRQLVDLFQFYMAFPISNYDSEPISDEDMMAAHYARVQQLQLLLFYKHPALKDIALHNCGTVTSRKDLLEHISALPLEELKSLVVKELRQAEFSISPSSLIRGSLPKFVQINGRVGGLGKAKPNTVINDQSFLLSTE